MTHSSENTKNFIWQYWRFFETLENDFLATERFVSLDEDNYDTFSVEYNRLYQSIGSEIDVIAKLLCNLLGDHKADKIYDYYKTITSYCGMFTDEQVCINRSVTIKPWDKWIIKNMNGKEKLFNPEWWSLYNKVKHNRQTVCTDNKSKWYDKPYYKCATQYNVLSALAGLYILEFYCLLLICKSDCISSDDDANSIYNAMLPIFSSKLFSMSFWEDCHGSFIGEFVSKISIERRMIERKINIERGASE